MSKGGKAGKVLPKFQEYLKLALHLAGSSAFGCVAAIAWHEAGHIIVILGCGGEMTRIQLQPFTRSVVTYNIPASAPLLWISAAGILMGVTSGVLLLAALRTSRSPYALPLVMTGVASLLGNGLYLVLGSTILEGFGDPGRMIALGFPAGGLFTAGGCCLAWGGLAVLRFLPLTGVSPAITPLKRAGVLLGGSFPYLAGIIIYNSMYDFPRLTRYCFFMAMIVVMILLGNWMAGYLIVRLFNGNRPVGPVRWRHAWAAIGFGAGVIAVELYAAGPSL
ncbi:MAG: hypothetical protein WC450_11645 [Candidatus Omnitrophota bacterium]